MNLKFNFEATGIGSVPFKDPQEACRIILDNFDSMPFWPQLPKRTFLENMYVQFSERMPGLVLNEAEKTIHVDTSKVVETIEEVYSKSVEGDVDYFAVSESRAQGLYVFPEALKKYSRSPKFVKGQITGPISFALSIADQNKRALIYDKDLFEILTKILAMRVKWQVKRLKKISPNVIIFIDEPYLVAIGSSYVNINIEDAFSKFTDVAKAVKESGALCGIHCCGNTDWGMLLKRDIDIVNFDAYNFTKEFLLYSPDLSAFMQRGGTVALGIVPSSADELRKFSKSALKERAESALGAFNAKGIARDKSFLITPSCGLGTLDDDDAKRAIEASKAVSELLARGK